PRVLKAQPEPRVQPEPRAQLALKAQPVQREPLALKVQREPLALKAQRVLKALMAPMVLTAKASLNGSLQPSVISIVAARLIPMMYRPG
ncbi:MAG TPA: hypothetical protein PLN94_07465, partial [Thiolinea sp.]|nr:hypothetical protein [Thiolinea sp.]